VSRRSEVRQRGFGVSPCFCLRMSDRIFAVGRMSNRPMWVYSLSYFIHVVLSVLTHSCCYARPFARRHFRSSNRIYDMSGASRRIEVLRDHVAPADDEVRARKIRPSHARTSRTARCRMLFVIPVTYVDLTRRPRNLKPHPGLATNRAEPDDGRGDRHVRRPFARTSERRRLPGLQVSAPPPSAQLHATPEPARRLTFDIDN
jgi:hypothetical protein